VHGKKYFVASLRMSSQVRKMLVSIIIPVFNKVEYINDAIRSVFNLNYHPIEVILVDDASNDGSYERLLEWQSRKPNDIKIYRHPDNRNLGPSESRNLGIKHAGGEAICFLDADDMVLPHRLDTATRILQQRPDIDGVYDAVGMLFDCDQGKADWGERALQWPGMHVNNPDDLLRAILFGKMGMWHVDSILVRKALFEKIGLFDTKLRLGEDLNMCLRMAIGGNIIAGETERPVGIVRRSKNHTWYPAKFDIYRDVFCLGMVLLWARKRRNSIYSTRYAVLCEGFKEQTIKVLQFLRSERQRMRAIYLAIYAVKMTPSVIKRRLFWGNLLYCLLSR
jgi:glycosyltransferase involved in cell wall biosynthesis